MNTELAGFPLALENLEKWEKFFQSEKSQGFLKFYQKVRGKSGNFKILPESQGISYGITFYCISVLSMQF